MVKKAKPLSRVKIRKLVNNIRLCFDLGQVHAFPIMQFLEYTMCLLFDSFVLEIVEDTDLDCEARAYTNDHKIKIRQSVYDGACKGNPRDRFTIAHEIGHIFLHNEDSISFARGDKETIKTYEDPEWQANTFAGELLAPPDLIKNLTEVEISQKCKVSQQVARIQKSYCN